MNIVEEKNGEVLKITFIGKIDKITSMQVQNSILQGVQKTQYLILDFGQVEYISSAGLRALLLGQKSAAAKGGRMELINVGNEVLAVLKLSGFDKILTIS